MDPLDVMMNKEKVIPYYQPIISADKQLIIGYEVLAKLQSDEGVRSLGWFFNDRSIPDEYRLELEDHIQKMAINNLIISNDFVNLFFHYDATLLLKDNGETLLKRLDEVEKEYPNIKSQVVIQLDEQVISKQVDDFKHLLTYIQSTGIRIAINNVGFNHTNLDNLALLKPNIVKVDVDFLDEDSLPHLYREVHHSISMLSRKIGATLLFEGISSFNQLNYAWRNGGRYYQGDYLSKAHSSFIPLDDCKEKIQKEFQHFITFERKKVESQIQLSNVISQKLKQLIKMTSFDQLDEHLLHIATSCHDFAFRVYICDQEGFQQTANAEKNSTGKWELLPEGRYKNWSWRPYFLENIVRMNVEKKGLLSDLYTDIERDERIRTYSYPLSDFLYLFIDIPYDYLFEQEGLL
ncbi:EAL domain-containing protein [Alkalihalobacillus trypoxylicola]|uniref:Diguanylate phosphodiesterase n=1 Tax=Alkalihalobacillus trypoxylicola TaxID=519424 RepID=A0A162F665_9BACI|nr:EAL-associated domain-containing protein [Alkalihalobacillus trypoxylicola]KYG34872.1 diguanylate phosphodiesterase [Alkalihalobacillus trypoxylicola]